jgi:subtilisin family serine protease
MKTKILSLIISLFLLSVCSLALAQGNLKDSGQGKKLLNERIIVKFKGGDLDPEVEDDVFNSHKVKKHKFMKELKSYVVLAPSKNNTLDIIDNLKKRKDVEYAEPDYYCEPVSQTVGPNDPQLGSQWQINNINLQGAWTINKGSSNIIIAVLDSGCDPNHEDLKDKYVAGYNFFDNNTNTADVYGHGTAVAGCIAPATNNGIGIAGTAYNCRIMPLRISDTNGYAYWSTLATALQYAANNGCKVANASFRCGESTTVQNAAKYMNSKGGVFICSAGNQATLVTTSNFPEIIVVGATDASNNLAGFSNTGTVCLFLPLIMVVDMDGGVELHSHLQLQLEFVH